MISLDEAAAVRIVKGGPDAEFWLFVQAGTVAGRLGVTLGGGWDL